MPRHYWRPLIPRERDPELIWGTVVGVGFLLAMVWLLAGLPTPHCLLHEATGIPCPSCGTTRGMGLLIHGHITAAIRFNPLVMASLFGGLLFLLYALVVVAGKLPRLRFDPLHPNEASLIRILVVCAVATDWIYLIARERLPGALG